MSAVPCRYGSAAFLAFMPGILPKVGKCNKIHQLNRHSFFKGSTRGSLD
jgi:hypothetical protein